MDKNEDVAIDDGQAEDLPPAGPHAAEAPIDTQAMQGAPAGALHTSGAAAAPGATGAVDLEM